MSRGNYHFTIATTPEDDVAHWHGHQEGPEK